MLTEDYDEMVDIWSFGMVILELVTQQLPYSECKGAFQAYQVSNNRTYCNPFYSLIDIKCSKLNKNENIRLYTVNDRMKRIVYIQTIISGTKPLVLSQISNPYIRSFIDICLNITAKCRPTALELLSHPFLLSRASDKILCHKGVKPKSRQIPEPPASPEKANDTNHPITPLSEIEESIENPEIRTLSEERIVVEAVDVINDNKTKITMQIFSHAFPDKIMTVAFEYDKTKDLPRSVADEMVQALKLQKYFVEKIQSAILKAVKESHTDRCEDAKEENVIEANNQPNHIENEHEIKLESMKIAQTDQDLHRSHIMKLNSPKNMNRGFSKENVKLKKRQDTHAWLIDHELSDLIPIFDKEGLTMGHLKDATNDDLKEMRDMYKWNVVIYLKLRKAVEEIQPATSQNSQYIEQEQTRILDELSRKHQIVSRDINTVKGVINGLLIDLI